MNDPNTLDPQWDKQYQAFPHDLSITVKLFTKIVGYDYGQFFTNFDHNATVTREGLNNILLN